MTPPDLDAPTAPVLCPPADEAPTDLLPVLRRRRARGVRAVRVAWVVFALVMLAFYAVPTGAALGWWG